ncbi:hypothetical protein J9317_15405 [Metabacillus sp. KIGAM252]|uniref:Uncharacterized protein n=1 Tax=Metabacillus flavus TaxID=2823519 RepID=A0ABS5LHB7_9BACI|nr:hypothetical protein [Metabacillus flavus]MBS2970156.1 hypothetical protein [Metabacillus flavus]
MDWKEHFTKDIAMNFRTDTDDLEAAIESYVSGLSETEILQLTKKMDAENLRDILAQSILNKIEKDAE